MQIKCYGFIPFIDQNGVRKYCILRHRAGHWSFPKGHPNQGERPIETARRELFEEAGIKSCRRVSGFAFTEHFTLPKRNAEKIVTFFICKTPRPELTPDNFKHEIVAQRWLTYEETMKLLTFPETKKMLTKVHRFLEHSQRGRKKDLSTRKPMAAGTA